jgi:cephalosporin hydroxylase
MLVTIDKTVTRGHQQVCDLFPARILAIYGDSTDEKIIHHAMAEGDYDVVIIDGGHDWRTTSSDWNSYASMAKSGGLVVVHDTQGYHNFRDFDVPTMWATVRKRAKSVDLVSMPGVEAGTGIVWAGEGEWWDVL